MMFFVSLCVVAVVAARVIFPKEVREELHEEIEELRDHGHHAEKKENMEVDKPLAGEEPEAEHTPGPCEGNQEVSQEKIASAQADEEVKTQEPDGWEGEEDQ